MFHMFHKRKGVTLLNAPNKFFPCRWRIALVNTFISDFKFLLLLTTCSVLTSVTVSLSGLSLC